MAHDILNPEPGKPWHGLTDHTGQFRQVSFEEVKEWFEAKFGVEYVPRRVCMNTLVTGSGRIVGGKMYWDKNPETKAQRVERLRKSRW